MILRVVFYLLFSNAVMPKRDRSILYSFFYNELLEGLSSFYNKHSIKLLYYKLVLYYGARVLLYKLDSYVLLRIDSIKNKVFKKFIYLLYTIVKVIPISYSIKIFFLILGTLLGHFLEIMPGNLPNGEGNNNFGGWGGQNGPGGPNGPGGNNYQQMAESSSRRREDDRTYWANRWVPERDLRQVPPERMIRMNEEERARRIVNMHEDWNNRVAIHNPQGPSRGNGLYNVEFYAWVDNPNNVNPPTETLLPSSILAKHKASIAIPWMSKPK